MCRYVERVWLGIALTDEVEMKTKRGRVVERRERKGIGIGIVFHRFFDWEVAACLVYLHFFLVAFSLGIQSHWIFH